MVSTANKTIFSRNLDCNKLIKECIPHKKRLSDKESVVIQGDIYKWIQKLNPESFDLIIVDPPYNLTKTFGYYTFNEKNDSDYEEWIETWLPQLYSLLKPNGSLYLCCDWKCSTNFYRALSQYFYIQNRITWEREKGRGAKNNWKNCSEDIWFVTKSKDYTFNVGQVKHKKTVVAPYRNESGSPKDWKENKEANYRLTHPSNLWSDITVPFWSMSENTEHPTQKPEKLIAKLILASSNVGDWVLDPFAGVGTVPVVAKKLNRSYVGIEQSYEYCAIAQYRLSLAEEDQRIQGYEDWEGSKVFTKNR